VVTLFSHLQRNDRVSIGVFLGIFPQPTLALRVLAVSVILFLCYMVAMLL
jgi:hypothetical protein